MPMKLNDFLLEYYKRYIFRNMPPEQFAQFSDYLDKNDMRGNMKHWAKELLEPDPHDPTKYLKVAGVYVRKPLLGEADLEPNDWVKFYTAFQNAFSNLSANRENFKYDDKVLKFLDQYFGADKLFNHTPATPDVERALTFDLAKFLARNPDKMEIQLREWGALSDDMSVQDLIDGINDQKYNTDLKFRGTVSKIAQYLNYYQNDDDVKKKLGITNIPDLSIIFTGFRNAKPTPRQINAFKLEFHRLLQELKNNSAAYDAFKAHDDGKISKHLDAANEFLDFDNPESKNYLRPKREDRLTLPQRMSEWVSDQYDEYLAKYIKFSGDRLYFSPQAKDIVAALNKQKVKPTDGLDGIVAKAGDISAALKAADKETSAKHMDWFVKQLKDFQTDKNMSHIYKGALKNGTQMNALVQEIIYKAVRENKTDEAATALEVLSVVKFGYTTSAIMDALRGQDFVLFSDDKLTWNKQEGMKIVSSALDKSIKAAFMGIGYGITMATNAVRLAGSKIQTTNKNLSALRRQIQTENDNAKTQLANDIARETAEKTNTENYLNRMATYGVTEASLNTKIGTLDASLNTLQGVIDTNIQTLANWYEANPTHPNAMDVILYVNNVQSGQHPAPLPPIDPAVDAAIATLDPILTRRNREQARIKSAQTRLIDLRNANATVAALSDQLTRHQTALAEWDDKHIDQAERLANLWNQLETGRGSHTGTLYNWFGSKSAAQKELNNKKQSIIDAYRNSHSIGMAA